MNQESLTPNNDKETTSEATNTSNRIASVESIADSPPDVVLAAIQTECKANCANDSNFDKCVDDCVNQHAFHK